MILKIWEQGSLSKGSLIFCWGIKEERAAAHFELKQREQLLIRVEAKLTNFRTIPRAWTLILHASPSETKKKESTRVGPTDQSRSDPGPAQEGRFRPHGGGGPHAHHVRRRSPTHLRHQGH